ncbi:uncharacterized protein MONBRDRAFT_35709 [Monosiga brevicollis MX1]|uniref:EF-hand domain-containing protein n=1 Tax=Monosiga brevicollis TaxID=81824 RepID=A9UQV7_MONBE|nr:uncharacterized protein MONBRDRAFT_35709 [Monosiga brevicollis MX1]EDQ92665.1 predicted protein [Monosiga brevicollis MX1]|eukprot:XP_001742427.1 hypothetical protein [Monosiga brevicollis MX1]
MADEADVSVQALKSRVAQLESDLRVSQFTIQQLEAENAALTKSLGDPQQHPTGHAKKKKKKGGKKLSGGARTSNEGLRAAGASSAVTTEAAGMEPVTYEAILEAFPNIRLSEVLRAEKSFSEADINSDGLIDVAELDKWLSKEGLIFSVSQVTAILLTMDLDGNDSVDFMEFLTVCQSLKNPEQFSDEHKDMAPTTQAAFATIRRNFIPNRRASKESDPNLNKSTTCSIQ